METISLYTETARNHSLHIYFMSSGEITLWRKRIIRRIPTENIKSLNLQLSQNVPENLEIFKHLRFTQRRILWQAQYENLSNFEFHMLLGLSPYIRAPFLVLYHHHHSSMPEKDFKVNKQVKNVSSAIKRLTNLQLKAVPILPHSDSPDWTDKSPSEVIYWSTIWWFLNTSPLLGKFSGDAWAYQSQSGKAMLL